MEPVLAALEVAVHAVQILVLSLSCADDLNAMLNVFCAPILSALNGEIDALGFEASG